MRKGLQKILVVDEEREMRELLRLHLTSAGYDVAIAEDVIQAGYHILSSPPDLLIADIDLRFMSSIDLAATLMADSTLPHIPVIFLSSNREIPARAEALSVSYLVKPILADMLLCTVRNVLGNDRPLPAAELPQVRNDPAPSGGVYGITAV